MRRAGFGTTALLFVLGLFLASCGQSKGDPKAEAPPPVKVESEQDLNVFQVDHPQQFPLATAAAHESASQLTVTGTVSPDISRSLRFRGDQRTAGHELFGCGGCRFTQSVHHFGPKLCLDSL